MTYTFDWKLTIPTGSPYATTIYPVTEQPPYYEVVGDRQIFRTPSDGVTTSGSSYPRTEMREMRDGVEASWSLSTGEYVKPLKRTCSVDILEAGHKTIIGQIHGGSNELCRLYYEDGVIYFANDKSGFLQEERKLRLVDSRGNQTNIPLGSRFSYIIKPSFDLIKVGVVHKGVVYWAADKIQPFWMTDLFYYKYGDYYQKNTGSFTCQVSFYNVQN